MTTKWRYGDSWEKFPIKDDETWLAEDGSAVTVTDIRDGLPEHMRGVDLLYADPPWSQGNVNTFLTKAGVEGRRVRNFGEFLDALEQAVLHVNPRICYLEAGSKHVDDVADMLGRHWPQVYRWKIRYYRKHPCWLLRAGHGEEPPRNMTGMDDEETPLAAIEADRPSSVADCCAGRGLTAIAAHRYGIPFHGTELNRRRLAVAIERANSMGAGYAPANT